MQARVDDRRLEIHAWLDGLTRSTATGDAAWRPELAQTAAELLRSSPPASEDPGDLVARACAVPAWEWHLGNLEALLGRPGAGPAAAERLRYHARWLHHLLDPEDPEQHPLVSVVIPAYDDAHLLPAAVESAFAQTHPRIEVLVVDDGSSDHPEKALAPFSHRAGRTLVVLHQENRGVAAARNAGLDAATGELIQILDADDLLDPDAVERKLLAWRVVPDAEVCVSRSRSVGSNQRRDAATHRGPDFGGEHCPTRDLLDACVRRYAFHTSTVLIPRWLHLEVGPWDAQLTHGSDSRYWFRLGLRDTKVIALRDELGTRRFREGSLTTRDWDRQLMRPGVFVMALVDLLDRPRTWHHLGPLLVRMRRRARWQLIAERREPAIAAAREALLERVERLGSPERRGGLSTAGPLLLIREHLLEGAATAPRRGFEERLATALAGALARAAEPDVRDLRFWLGAPEDPPPDPDNQPALAALLAWVDAGARRGALPVSLDALREIGRRAPESEVTRRLAALARAPDRALGSLAWRRIRLGQHAASWIRAARRRVALRTRLRRWTGRPGPR